MAIKIIGTTVIDDSRQFIPNTVSAGGTTGKTNQVLVSTGVGVTWANSSGSGEFNTGISSSVQVFPRSWETSSFTFPSTEGKRYVIQSINVANVAAATTEVNIISRIGTADEKSHLAYNVPIVSGGLVEILKQPIVANPNDEIRSWSTDYQFVGIDTATEMYISYTEFDDTDYFRVIASDVTVPTGDLINVYTSTEVPSMIQSVHIVNKTNESDFTVSVTIKNGSTLTYLAKDLIIPRYATVNIMDRPKRIELNGILGVQVGQVSTVDLIISGKKIRG